MRDVRPTLRSLEDADMATKPKKVQITTSLLSVPLSLPSGTILRHENAEAMVSWPTNGVTAGMRPSSEGCLVAFLELAKASDDEVVAFAADWGVLLLENVHRKYKVEEQFSATASAVAVSTADIHLDMIKQSPGLTASISKKYVIPAGTDEYRWKEWPIDWDCEPIEVYRRYALQARALLQIAAKLGDKELAGIDLWRQAIRPDAPSEFRWPRSEDFRKHCQPEHDIEVQRHLLGKLVTLWIEKSSLQPQFTWQATDYPQVMFNVNLRYEGSDFDHITKLWHSERALFQAGKSAPPSLTMTLFNVLTLQLLALLTSRNGVHICDGEGCAKVFTPEGRKGRHDCKSYCSTECSENARKTRSRNYIRNKRLIES
ncbi:MAG: hypothetical protein ACRYFS_20990 [Janthinobacterium lividum]